MSPYLFFTPYKCSPRDFRMVFVCRAVKRLGQRLELNITWVLKLFGDKLLALGGQRVAGLLSPEPSKASPRDHTPSDLWTNPDEIPIFSDIRPQAGNQIASLHRCTARPPVAANSACDFCPDLHTIHRLVQQDATNSLRLCLRCSCRYLLCGLSDYSSPKCADHSWPQFRGPACGIAGGLGLPDRWSTTDNVVWKTPVPGRGWSSPVVSGHRIFVTSAVRRTRPNGTGQNRDCICLVNGLPRQSPIARWSTASIGRPERFSGNV